MPASFSFYPNSYLKRLKLILLFLFFPLFFFGQTLTGLWTGALSNDSTTVRKDQLFEIALTEYKGKVYGYSRSEFIVNDTLYYIVKRVKGTIEGDVCEVTDDDIIAYNFRGKIDKGIKVTSTFRRNNNDSTWYLAGNWKTNATKKYYSVTGKVDLEQEKDLAASKIFPHLEELKLAGDIAFYKERNEGAPIVKIAKPQKVQTEYSFNIDPLSASADIAIMPKEPELQRAEPKAGPSEIITDIAKEEPEETLPEFKKPDGSLPKTETKNVATGPSSVKPSATGKAIALNKPAVVEQKQTVSPDPANNSQPSKPAATSVAVTDKPKAAPTQKVNKPADNAVAKNTETPLKPNTIATNTETRKPVSDPVIQKPTTAPMTTLVSVPPVTKPVVAPKPIEEITAKVATIAGRKSEFSQVVNFKSDSLQLSLYDNGEIDGDTVSIFMNGEVIMAKQGLKASAIRKTIYIKQGEQEDFTLVLFADNLGKYPPNTGLLVVHDGEDVYHLRFSSDFQKSSGIVFRRKK
jgi:hypothetical protein